MPKDPHLARMFELLGEAMMEVIGIHLHSMDIMERNVDMVETVEKARMEKTAHQGLI